MSGLINVLMIVGVLVGGVIAFQNRCEWFQLCNDGLFGTASAASGDSSTVNNYYDSEGNILDGTDPANDGTAGNDATEATVGCCHCKFVGDIAKCEVNGDGSWINPPAGSNGSNDKNVGWAAQDCYATHCKGAAAAGPAKTTSSSSNTPGTGNLGEKGTTYANGGKYPCNTGLCASSGKGTAACSHCVSSSSKSSGSSGSSKLKTSGSASAGSGSKAPVKANSNNSVVGSGQKIDPNKIRNAWAGHSRGFTYFARNRLSL